MYVINFLHVSSFICGVGGYLVKYSLTVSRTRGEGHCRTPCGTDCKQILHVPHGKQTYDIFIRLYVFLCIPLCGLGCSGVYTALTRRATICGRNNILKGSNFMGWAKSAEDNWEIYLERMEMRRQANTDDNQYTAKENIEKNEKEKSIFIK